MSQSASLPGLQTTEQVAHAEQRLAVTVRDDLGGDQKSW